MTFYLRKISRKYWPDDFSDDIELNRIPAEPLTRDMRADMNTFSVWLYDEANIDDGIAAIALGFDSFDELDIIKINQEELDNLKLTIKNTPESGNTKYVSQKENHYDILNMDYEVLGKVADLMLKEMRKDKVIKIDVVELANILNERIQSELIDASEISTKFLKKIDQYKSS